MALWNEDKSDVWSRRFTAWGSMTVTVSIFVLLAYALVVTSRLEDKQVFNGLIETLKAMTMIAVGFWLGSSNSGQKKDETIAEQGKALATATPSQPVVTTTTINPGPPPTATTTTTPVDVPPPPEPPAPRGP